MKIISLKISFVMITLLCLILSCVLLLQMKGLYKSSAMSAKEIFAAELIVMPLEQLMALEVQQYR